MRFYQPIVGRVRTYAMVDISIAENASIRYIPWRYNPCNSLIFSGRGACARIRIFP